MKSFKKIISVEGEIKPTNSAYGKYAVPVIMEYHYENGSVVKQNTFFYSWTMKFIKDVIVSYQNIKFSI